MDTSHSQDSTTNREDIEKLIADLGGVEALLKMDTDFREAVDRLWSEYDALVERHPHKWVAMSRDGLVAVGDSIEEVLSVVDSKGLGRSEITLEYLDPDPDHLILLSDLAGYGHAISTFG